MSRSAPRAPERRTEQSRQTNWRVPLRWVGGYERRGTESEQLTTIFEDLACSEIGDLYPESAIEEEILRFKVSGRGLMSLSLMGWSNVPVDNVLVVHVLDSIDDLGCIIPRARQRQGSEP